MGKGDRKSKKGKRFMGSFGNSRKRKVKDRKFVVQKKSVHAMTGQESASQVAEMVDAGTKTKAKRAGTTAKKAKAAPKKAAKKGGEESPATE